MSTSAEGAVESRNILHPAIRAAAYLNKHSHALEESILRRTIVQVSEDKSSEEPVAYCPSCDARTVDKCLQLLSQLDSSALQIVVKKTAEVLTNDAPKVAAAVPSVKNGFKPSLDCKRRPMITNFSYAKMKKVVKDDMSQKVNKTLERTLREAAFFNPKGSSEVGPRKPRSKTLLKGETGKRGGYVASNVGHENQDLQTIRNQTNSETNLPAPQVKLDANGQIVVDPLSLIVPLPRLALNSQKSTQNNVKWPFEDTVKFYEALHQHGTDFSMMVSVFNNRMRSNLKRKFIAEDKKNRKLVDMVVRNGSTQSDLQDVIRQLKIQNDLKLITRVKKF